MVGATLRKNLGSPMPGGMTPVFRKIKSSASKVHFFVACQIDALNKHLVLHLILIICYLKYRLVNHIY